MKDHNYKCIYSVVESVTIRIVLKLSVFESSLICCSSFLGGLYSGPNLFKKDLSFWSV